MHLLIIGGSDAGISAGLRARELDPVTEVTLLVADRYPNFSICGIPYHVAGQVPDWRNLAHRTAADLEKAGLVLRLCETAAAIDPAARTVTSHTADGRETQTSYDRLVVATGATPARPPIGGLDGLGPGDAMHVLHTMDDTFALTRSLATRVARTAVIVGAGYIGMEMAEALTERGLQVTVLEQLDQVLPATLDPSLAAGIQAHLAANGVQVHTATTVTMITRDGGRLNVACADGTTHATDLVLVAAGVRPDTALAAAAGVALGDRGAIVVDRHMHTNIPGIYAAGDCVHTHHRLLPEPRYFPLGTTAHKQGRVAGENALGGDRRFAGVLGTQVVKIFAQVAAATGLRDPHATEAGYTPHTVEMTADDHKAYYPGAAPLRIRLTADAHTGQLLGGQITGSLGAEIAKRIDILATGIHHGITIDEISDLDLSYTPPLGSPWDALQRAAQNWAAVRRRTSVPRAAP